MNPNFEGAFEKWFGLPRRGTFYLSAIWVGSQMGAWALVVGFLFSGATLDSRILWFIAGSPMLLFSDWACLNAGVLILAFIRFCRSDSLSFRGWGIFTGLESVFSLLAHINDVQGPLAVSATWATWLVLISMMATGLWFFHQWRMNHWAGEIAMLKAENASRQARLERARDEDEDAS